MPIIRPGRRAAVATVAALMLTAATSAANAVSPVVRLSGSASLTRSSASGSAVTAAKFDMDAIFSTDTPGAQLFTIQRAVIFFPDHAGTNGRLFPSCSAKQIERFRGNIRRCPKGSQIGSGTARAHALGLGVTSTARVTVFNSHRGKSITFNFVTYLPAYINKSMDAPLTKLHGRYGEKLTITVPDSLQEIIPGVYVALEQLHVTTTGSIRRNGVTHSYLRARTCPKIPLHAEFDFKDWTTGQTASTTADAKIRCTAR